MKALSSRQFYTLRAWAVHFYTSLGLVFAFLAFLSILEGNPRTMFVLNGIAMFIDSTDGTLARRWKVTIWTPQFDGRKLDDIVDYLNYAFIPFFFAYRFGLVNGVAGLFTLFIIMIAAVYGFCQKAAKTKDGYFTGFPNYWNIVIFYLYLLNLPPQANSLILLAFAAMIFVPFGYASFSTVPMRRLTVTISGLYGLVLLAMIMSWDRLSLPVILVSLAFPAAYTVISLYLHFTHRMAS
jgi:phosphatidylcholine synthase